MNAKALNAKYEVRPAIVDKDSKYSAWVYSKAQELDLKDPRR